MSNTYSSGADDVDMSNGGTEVFAEVLMLAVSALARREWDFRFASLLARQDQNAFGRGNVGFDLADIDWGPNPDEAKQFVLDVIDLALTRHRWDELGYDPPFAEGYLRKFRALVANFDPATAKPYRFPDEIVIASCVRHRVLSPRPEYRECVFCTRDWTA